MYRIRVDVGKPEKLFEETCTGYEECLYMAMEWGRLPGYSATVYRNGVAVADVAEGRVYRWS